MTRLTSLLVSTIQNANNVVTLHNFALENTFWPWRTSKHRNRDWKPIIDCAIVEKMFATNYRVPLLQRSPAAQLLRQRLKPVLEQFTKVRSCLPTDVLNRNVTTTDYLYPDEFRSTITQADFEPDVVTIETTKASIKRRVDAHAEIKSTVDRILDLSFAKVDQGTDAKVAPRVARATKALVRVCLSIFSRRYYTQSTITPGVVQNIRGTPRPGVQGHTHQRAALQKGHEI
jgi:hypothetical protein